MLCAGRARCARSPSCPHHDVFDRHSKHRQHLTGGRAKAVRRVPRVESVDRPHKLAHDTPTRVASQRLARLIREQSVMASRLGKSVDSSTKGQKTASRAESQTGRVSWRRNEFHIVGIRCNRVIFRILRRVVEADHTTAQKVFEFDNRRTTNLLQSTRAHHRDHTKQKHGAQSVVHKRRAADRQNRNQHMRRIRQDADFVRSFRMQTAVATQETLPDPIAVRRRATSTQTCLHQRRRRRAHSESSPVGPATVLRQKVDEQCNRGVRHRKQRAVGPRHCCCVRVITEMLSTHKDVERTLRLVDPLGPLRRHSVALDEPPSVHVQSSQRQSRRLRLRLLFNCIRRTNSRLRKRMSTQSSQSTTRERACWRAARCRRRRARPLRV